MNNITMKKLVEKIENFSENLSKEQHKELSKILAGIYHYGYGEGVDYAIDIQEKNTYVPEIRKHVNYFSKRVDELFEED